MTAPVIAPHSRGAGAGASRGTAATLCSVNNDETRGAAERDVRLPAALVREFRIKHRANRTSGSALLYGWITQAARYAQAGQYELVPPRSATASSSGEQLSVTYSQSAAEAQHCSAVLRDAGSSIRAVAAACIEAYLKADNAVDMEWPVRKQPTRKGPAAQ